jgi:hypothetical protein
MSNIAGAEQVRQDRGVATTRDGATNPPTVHTSAPREETRDLKQAIMQELLTGGTRLV